MLLTIYIIPGRIIFSNDFDVRECLSYLFKVIRL